MNHFLVLSTSISYSITGFLGGYLYLKNSFCPKAMSKFTPFGVTRHTSRVI